MSFGGRNSSRFKVPKAKKSVMEQYQSGQIDYETYKQMTTPRLAGVPFTGRLQQAEKFFNSTSHRSKMSSIGSISMSSSFGSLTSTMASTAAGTRKSLTTSVSNIDTNRGTAKMVFSLPPSRESSAGSLGKPGLGTSDSLNELKNSINQKSVRTASEKKPPTPSQAKDDERGLYALELWKDKLPPHQYKVMKEDPMYTPDPHTGIAHWPIPGMQGSRSPFRTIPFGSGPDRKMTTTQREDLKKGVAPTGKFEWGDYKSEGIGAAVTWRGKGVEEITRVQRSYEQSGMMRALVPGPAEATRTRRSAKPGSLPVC